MQRRIVCAGCPRSGSTWLYNVVRLLLAKSGASVYGAWVEDYDSARQEDIHVVKVHFPHQVTFDVDYCLTSRRDLRGVANSLVRIGWLKPDEAAISNRLRDYISNHAHWTEAADYELAYEQISTEPKAIIQALAKNFGVEILEDHVADVLADILQMAPPKQGEPYDQVTLLHPRHIGEQKEWGQITDEGLRKIQEEFLDWQRKHDYL